MQKALNTFNFVLPGLVTQLFLFFRTYAALKQCFDGVLYSAPSSASGLPPPLPWEIDEEAAQPFKDEVRLVEVPRTESTKTCHRCRGTGKAIHIDIPIEFERQILKQKDLCCSIYKSFSYNARDEEGIQSGQLSW